MRWRKFVDNAKERHAALTTHLLMICCRLPDQPCSTLCLTHRPDSLQRCALRFIHQFIPTVGRRRSSHLGDISLHRNQPIPIGINLITSWSKCSEFSSRRLWYCDIQESHGQSRFAFKIWNIVGTASGLVSCVEMWGWRKIGPFCNRALHCPTAQGAHIAALKTRGWSSARKPTRSSLPLVPQDTPITITLCNILANFHPMTICLPSWPLGIAGGLYAWRGEALWKVLWHAEEGSTAISSRSDHLQSAAD